MNRRTRLSCFLQALICAIALPCVAVANPTGILEVEANAAGAMVFVDGDLIGEAPILELVSAGRHVVRVERPGFASFEQGITIKADTSVQLKANLLRLAPGLEVRIDVDNAKVYLDGQHIGTGRKIVLDPATAGLHDLLVEHEAFGTKEVEVRLEAGTLTPVEFKLRGSLGSVAVHSDPEGARIHFDGKDYGPTPSTIDPVKAGNHSLRLSAEGKAEVLRQVVVEPGKLVTVDVEMVDEGGVLLVRPSVKTAQIFVNGVAIGVGKQELVNIEPGSYSVRVAAGGFMDFLKEVNVRSSGKTTVAARLEGFAYQNKGKTRLVGGAPKGGPVVKQPAFWVAIGSGVGAAVGITLAAVLGSQEEIAGTTPPGVAPPPTDHIFTLP